MLKRNAASSINNTFCRRVPKAYTVLAFFLVWCASSASISRGQTTQIDIFAEFPFSPNATGIRKNDLIIASPTAHTNYSFDDAIKVEATSLARGITDLLYARELVQRAKEGATVYVWLTKSKLMVDIQNVDEILKEIDNRLSQYRKAAKQRGSEKVSRAYDMIINFKIIPTLIDDRSGDYWWWNGFSYQPMAIVENKFAIKDYQNSEVTFIGNITPGKLIPVEIWVSQFDLATFDKIQPEKLAGKATWRAQSVKEYRYASAYSSRAGFFLGSGEFERALEDANSALAIDTKERDAYLVRSQIYASCPVDCLRDGTKALADADMYCKLATDSKIQWKCGVVRGNALAELARFDEAIGEIEYELQHAPDEAKTMLLARLEKFKNKTPHRINE